MELAVGWVGVSKKANVRRHGMPLVTTVQLCEYTKNH